MSPGTAAVWLALMAGAGLARWRFARFLRDKEDGHDLGRALARVEDRHGVSTLVRVRWPALAAGLDRDPQAGGEWLRAALAAVGDLAESFGAEVEVSDAGGAWFYFGRFRPNPDHRATALDFAGMARVRLAEVFASRGAEAPGLAVATGELSALPWGPGEAAVLCVGAAREAAGQLAARVPPGEVAVGGSSRGPDAEFAFADGPGGLRLLRGRRAARPEGPAASGTATALARP